MSFYLPQNEGPQDPDPVQATQVPGSTPPTPPATQDTSYVLDTFQGIGYGAQEFAQSFANIGAVFGLYDGVDFDAIDAPETAIGSVASAITQGGLGFVPGMGVAGGLGRMAAVLGTSSRVGRTAGAAASFAKTYMTPGGTMKLLNSSKASKDAATAAKGILAIQFQEAAAASIAFEGNAGRMADMFSDMGIENDFIGFLETNEEDSEAEGRFKNAIEGSILGVMAAPALVGVSVGVAKALRGYFKSSDAAMSVAEEAVKAGKGADDSVADALVETAKAAEKAEKDIFKAVMSTDFVSDMDNLFKSVAKDQVGTSNTTKVGKLVENSLLGKNQKALLMAMRGEGEDTMGEVVQKILVESEETIYKGQNGDAGARQWILATIRNQGEAMFADSTRAATGNLSLGLKNNDMKTIRSSVEAIQLNLSMLPMLDALEIPKILSASKNKALSEFKENPSLFNVGDANTLGKLTESSFEDLHDGLKINQDINDVTALLKGDSVSPEALEQLQGIERTLNMISKTESPRKTLQEIHAFGRMGFFGKLFKLAPEAKANGVLSLGGTLFNAVVSNGATFANVALHKLATSDDFLKVLGAGAKDKKVAQEGAYVATAGLRGAIEDSAQTMELIRLGLKSEGPSYLHSGTKADAGVSSFQVAAMNVDQTGPAGWVAKFAADGLSMPMTALSKTDEAYKMATGHYGLVERIRRNIVASGGSIEDANMIANQASQRALTAQNDLLAEGDMMRQLARMGDNATEAGDEGLAPAVAGSPFSGRTSTEIDAIQSAIKGEKKRIQRNTLQTPLTAGEYDNLVRRMGKWVNDSLSDKPLIKMLVPFVKVSTNAISATVYSPTVGGAGAMIELLSKRSAVKKGGFQSLANSRNSLLRRLASTDPEEVAIAATHMAVASVAVPTAVLGGAFMAMREDNGAPMITGAAPRDPQLARTWREMGIQEHSIWDGEKYVKYDRFDPVGGAISMLVDAAYTIENLSDNISDEGFTEAVGGFVGDIVAAAAENLTRGTGTESLERLLEIVNGSGNSTPSQYLGRELIAMMPLGASAKDLAGFSNALLGDGEIAEVDGFLDSLFTRYGGGTDGTRRDILGISKESSGLDYATRMRTSGVSDKKIADEMYSTMTSFGRMSSSYRGYVDLTDDAYTVNGQNAWDRAQELSGTVKIGGKDIRQALRSEMAKDSYTKLDAVGSDYGPSPRAARLKKVMERYRDKAMRQLLQERPSIRSDARTREREESRRVRGLTL